jgi:hypothetical protein
MDYTYDYDLDTLLESESGNSTTVGMLLYSFADVFMELNPKAKEIVSNLGFYIDIDNEGVSEFFKSFSEFPAFGCTTFNVCAMYDFDNKYKFSVDKPLKLLK